MNRDQWIESAEALLHLDEKKALVPHGIGGHARTLLEEAVTLLRAHNSDSAEPVGVVVATGNDPDVVWYEGPELSIGAELYLASPPAKEVDSRIKAFEEALTPSAETKAEYIGEFQFTVTMMELDDSDEPFEVQNMVTVPWTTIKEIMQAIRSRALTNRTPDDEVGNG